MRSKNQECVRMGTLSQTNTETLIFFGKLLHENIRRNIQ